MHREKTAVTRTMGVGLGQTSRSTSAVDEEDAFRLLLSA